MPENWTRDDWLGRADRLLAGARRHASPGHARITFPGAAGGYGHDVDGLEGFARTFLLAGFRLAGERGHGLEELADWYARGIATGTDPGSPERWVRLDEHGQAKVEAASLALILDLTRPWIWDRLKPAVQERVVDYLAPAVGDPAYPRTNWVWFRLITQTFLRSAGGPWSAAEMADDLATHDSFRRTGGWYADGATRAFDHYNGWALQTLPILWSRMSGAGGPRAQDVAALEEFLGDALALIGADGSPLLQGRSLIYRFAAAAPFWAGILAGVSAHPPGRLRHAATAIVRHFDGGDLLTLGWHHRWPRLAQSYSGPGSPYWASLGLLGIALPAGHPVWTAPAEPLPIETGDVLRAVPAAGWLISGAHDEGVVRVVNHGTDHDVEGSTGADSPLYARFGYSTAESPVLDESGWTTPEDQSVVLIDAAGRHSHRTGMRLLGVRVDDGVGVGGSTTLAHWVDTEAGPDHGSGRRGESEPAGRITVHSVVRGRWELRLCRVDDPSPAATRLRIGGGAGGLTSVLGDGTPGETTHDDASPLGDGTVRVPWLDHPVTAGRWVAALLGPGDGTAAVGRRDHGWEARVTWPDGVRTRTLLTKEYG